MARRSEGAAKAIIAAAKTSTDRGVLLSVAEAEARLRATVRPLGAEQVAVSRASGRVLAASVAARVSHPPSPLSAMDGYALASSDAADLPASLRQVGVSRAGAGYHAPLEPGTCVRIFTGAPIPPGADTIALQEDAEVKGGAVLISAVPPPGRFIRPAGLDIRAGETLAEAGRRLTARDVGLIAAGGNAWVRVRRQPRVAVLSTGDEVRMPGERLGPDQIYGSNGLALAACLRSWGAEPVDLGIAPDSLEAIVAAADAASGLDLLVTSGGSSVGEHDLVLSGLTGRGLSLDFWKIAMRPGKPLMFGRLGEMPVLGLPGNPVSALVCALLFLRPFVLSMQGAETGDPFETAMLGASLPANDSREDYPRTGLVRGKDGLLVAHPFERQDSAMLASLARADGVVRRRPFAAPAAPGDRVDIIRFASVAPGY